MKGFLLMTVLFVTGYLDAQTITKDSLLTMMSKDVCKEIEKKDFSKSDKSNLQFELGLLMVPTLTKNISAIEEIYGAGITDKKSMEKMSIDLAMKLMTNCPKFMQVAMELGQEKTTNLPPDEKVRFTPPKFVENESSENITGVLLSVNPSDFTSISIKDNKGKTQKLYWFEYFENSDYFSVNTKKFLQKKVVAQYVEKEVYDANKKEYKTIKVITGIALQ